MKPNSQRMVSGDWRCSSVGVNSTPDNSTASRHATARQANAGRLVGGLFLAFFFSGALAAILSPKAGIVLEIAVGLSVFGVVMGGNDDKRIKAGIQHDSHGKAKVFTLSLGGEVLRV